MDVVDDDVVDDDEDDDDGDDCFDAGGDCLLFMNK